MLTLTLSSTPVDQATADVLVIGVCEGPDHALLPCGADALAERVPGGLAAALRAAGATGAEGELTRVALPGGLAAPALAAIGLGSTTGPVATDVLRRAAGTAARGLAGTGRAAVALALANGASPSPAGELRAVCEGLLLGGYRYETYRTLANGRREPLAAAEVLTGATGGAEADAEVGRAQVLAEAVGLARDLVNTPPRDLPPAVLARIATEQATAAGLEVEVLDETELAAGGYGGILGVGQGSTRPPRLVRVAYRHPKATGTLALVGKGITFDSGGLSLKPSASMETMKSDMAGSAAVLATAIAAARLGLAVNVTSWLPLAENLPSGSAIRPSDVLTIRGGRTVEVLNTDAEGRLVLADALVRAGEESPGFIVDVATLTGAQVVALGSRTSAVMGNSDGARAAIVAAAERSGEPTWPMPLPGHLRRGLDSPVADLKNIGDAKAGGGMLVAGLFLAEFIPPGLAWAHLDIAGPSFNSGDPWGDTPRGGTGVPVRTLVALAEDLARPGAGWPAV